MVKKCRKKKQKFPVVIFLMIIIIVVGCLFINNKELMKDNLKLDINVKNNPKLKIIDENSNSRPIAVMINNHPQAVSNHAGLQDAYLVYEIIVEGGYTRMMAIFKDKSTEKIGSVRSSRHYFLDYALENDAIYVHYGWSPQAQSDIINYSINNINGLYDSAFWRDSSLNVAYEHTAFTSIGKIKQMIDKKGYRQTSNKKMLLSYSLEPVNLSEIQESILANEVIIPYSNYQETTYKYDADNKVYKRFVNNKEHMDAITKKQYTTKNIIIQKVSNYAMDSYGRQDINNVGNGDGYFITNGYAVPIQWTKASRQDQTIYKYKDGKVINVNDGNTYIQIQPINQITNIY